MFRMREIVRAFITLLLVVPLTSGLHCTKCGEDLPDIRDLANSMADEFSGMLEFEDGTLEDGPPPRSDSDGPRLDSFTAPLLAGANETLPDGTIIGYEYLEWFPVLFRSTDDAANLEHVAGAYAYVQQANTDDVADSHIRVHAWEERTQVGPETIFLFLARVHRLAALQSQLTQALRGGMGTRDVPEGQVATDGNAYHIYIALFATLPDGTEKVGNYLIWNLSTYPKDAGDNAIEMCVAHSAFTADSLVDTNVHILGVCDAAVNESFGDRPSPSSPVGSWNHFASGHNTIIDTIEILAPDPDYQEQGTVLYPAGTRFFRHDNITQPPVQLLPDACQLELAWCPRDQSRCQTEADCPAGHICCDNLCRDTSISVNFCGGCDTQCDINSESCLDGICGHVGCTEDTDCPAPQDICCTGSCFNSRIDNNHCGYCDNPCLAVEECQGGVCIQELPCSVDNPCPGSNEICCDNQCYNSMSNPDHCGVCNNSCSGTEVCSGGDCSSMSQCTQDQDCQPLGLNLCCGTMCYDRVTDPNHCGDCLTVCAPTEECLDATCIPLHECDSDTDCQGVDPLCCDYVCYDAWTDPNHCGACSIVCGAGEECVDGGCTQQPECSVDADCPQMDDICCNLTCYDSLTDPNHCGQCNNPCGADEECVDGGCNQLPQCTIGSDCPPPLDICCNDSCFNSLLDRNHCGQCDNPCGPTDECADGFCLPIPECQTDNDCPQANEICCQNVCFDSLTDNNHCGVCDIFCIGPDTCQDGRCCPPEGCTNEQIIARWEFNPTGPFSIPDLVATEVAANVNADNFTSMDGVLVRMTSPGPVYWVGEDNWPDPNTMLMIVLYTEPGWLMDITRVEFDQAMLGMSAGSPNVWELSTMGGPGPFAAGPITTEVADSFVHEDHPVPPDIYDPAFVEFLLRAQGAVDQGVTWGVDNFTIYGIVHQ